MSQENVEIVRRLIEAIASADYDRAAKQLDPDAEWHNTAVFPGPRTVVGADAIREFWRDLFGAFGGGSSGAAMEVEKVADAGDVVVVLVHGWGRGRGSGIRIDTQWAHSFRIRDSKVLRVETYGRFAKALEATGLRE